MRTVAGIADFPFEERKNMKRNLIYHTHIPLGEKVTIETEQNYTTKTDLESISRDGITVICNQLTLNQILPNAASVAPKQPVALPVSFTLGQGERIKASCNVVAVRRLSKDTFQMVMRFREISEEHFELVDHYIESILNEKSHVPLEQVA